MALNREREAVWIDDGVWDMNGVLVGYVDASDWIPSDKNFEMKWIVYKQPIDTKKSLIMKLLGSIKLGLFRLSRSKDNAERLGFNVSPEPVPKPAIEGYPYGKTVDGLSEKSDSTPEKRLIIKEDKDGNAPYAESVWGSDSDSKSVTQLKDRIRELEQRLSAEEGKNEELDQELDREEDNVRGRGRSHGDLFPEDEYATKEEY